MMMIFWRKGEMEMPSTSFRVGIIGFGGIGEQHFLHLSRFQDVAVEVICDRDENRLRKAQQVCGMPRLATCAEEVFSLPLQAVVVATPNVTHYPLVKEALLRGWHVLCEKPFTMDATQAEELCRLAGARELVHMVAFSYRFVPAAKMLREILERGQAGRIYHVRCHYLQSWLSSPFAPYSWRLDVQQSGSGVLGDLGSHVFDLAEFLTGKKFLRVQAYARTFVPERKDPVSGKERKVTVDDAVGVWGEMEEGIFFTAEMSRCATGRGNAFTVEVNGDRGGFLLDVEKPGELLACPEPFTEYTHFRSNFASFPCPSSFGPVDHYYAQTEAFVQALRGEPVVLPSFFEGWRTQRVLDACIRSIQQGDWQAI